VVKTAIPLHTKAAASAMVLVCKMKFEIVFLQRRSKIEKKARFRLIYLLELTTQQAKKQKSPRYRLDDDDDLCCYCTLIIN